MKRTVWIIATATICLHFTFAVAALAEQAGSIENPGQPKAVFDFRIAQPKAAQLMLELILKTYNNLTKEDRNPNFVVVFEASSVKLITTNGTDFSDQEQQIITQIRDTLTQMDKNGIKLEGGVLAAYFADIDPATFLPEIHPVENGLVSVIDYQSASYSLVPVY